MRLLTRTQSRELDRIAIDEMGIPGIQLMGNAGKEVASGAKKLLEKVENPSVAVICGSGNNGGDGYAAAVFLHKWSISLTIFALPEANEIKGDALHFYSQCRELSLSIVHGIKLPKSVEFDLIIDGLLGTGFRGELRAPILEWTRWLNRQKSAVLAIDIPSGVNANTGESAEDAVKANTTVTMGYTKLGMMCEPGFERCGNIIPVGIGFPDIADDLPGLQWKTFNDAIAKKYLTPPPRDTYKHRQGKVLILAGSTGMTGAAIMSTVGALRSGVGLTVTCAPASLNAIYESNILEGMTLSCEDQGRGYLGEENYDQIKHFFDWCNVILIGPGLGHAQSTMALVEKILLSTDKSVVIDADGLICLAQNRGLFNQIKVPFVITPHYGELGAIIGKSHPEIKSNFPEIVEEFMGSFPGILVAKNAPTCIASDNQVVLNTTGNQGLATGGTGDVLAGVISGFIAQGIPAFEATQLGVFVHGLAADKAVKDKGYRGLLASDVIRSIPAAIASYEHQ